MDELKPILQEFFGQPIAFLGGLVSGFLRLNLNEDPLKSWLEQQGGSPPSGTNSNNDKNGKGGGPQSISID